MNVYGECDTILIAYTGYEQTARLNDNLDDTLAFKIRTRVTNVSGQGQQPVPVTFYTNKGYFKEANSNVYNTTTLTIHNTLGLAEVTLVLSNLSGGFGGQDFDYTVQSRAGSVVREHSERCIRDSEMSSLPSTYTHKRLVVDNPATEIPGDNLPDWSSEDPNDNIKDIYVEVEYAQGVDPATLADICGMAKYVFERGKQPGVTSFDSSDINIIFCIAESCLIGFPMNAAIDSIQAWLAATRDSANAIHCIVGYYGEGSYETLGGFSWGYTRRQPENYNYRIYEAGRGSSSESIGSTRTDSMGIFIAHDRITDLAQQVGGYASWTNYAGVILAHEIGHALGLDHTPDSDGPNIMRSTIPLTMDWSLNNWGFLWLHRLHDSNPLNPNYIDALDTHFKLGVETEALLDHAFDRY